MAKQRNMPDVAQENQAPISGLLDRVGMSKIEVGLKVQTEDMGLALVPGFADAYVNLVDPQAKGIHMSRLFLNLHEGLASGHLSAKLLNQIATHFLETHAGKSNSSYVSVSFQMPVNRKALVSDNWAFRHYSAKLAVNKTPNQTYAEVSVVVPYSSTCPCSAALARQLIQEEFSKDFEGHESVDVQKVSQWLRQETSIVATPHSQRSNATVAVRFENLDAAISHLELINLIEASLKTPVQAAVKREDEQEFARLNGSNLMFCEDASRRLQSVITSIEDIFDYRIHVAHLESLHPHDAVSVVSGGRSSDWSF
jgi:GTP cyclohydrolase IB